jgi:hypothetical protein
VSPSKIAFNSIPESWSVSTVEILNGMELMSVLGIE